MGRQLYIYVGGKREGPYEVAEVREMLESEELDFDDFCQPVGSARRRRLSEIFEVVPGEEEDDQDEDWEDEGEGSESEGEDDFEDDAKDLPPPPGRLLYSGHPSMLNYPFSLLAAVGCGVGGYLLGPQSLWYFIIGSALAVGAVCFILVDRGTRQYVVTPRRVEVIWGLVVKSSNEVLIRDVRAINVRRAGLRGFLGVGTVEFSSVGDAVDVAFENIPRPQRVKRLVRALQDGEEES